MYDDLVRRLREHNGWALNETLDKAADAIEELIRRNEHYQQEQWGLSSALPTPQWIPFVKKEPTKGKRYLVTVRHNGNLIVDIDDYFVYGWDDWHDAVIAWAELPEPYKEGWYESGN